MKLRNYIVFDTKTFFANKEFVIKRARFNEDNTMLMQLLFMMMKYILNSRGII